MTNLTEQKDVSKSDYKIGDVVLLNDETFNATWYITNILEDGRIELKTTTHGFPVPNHCWGMYYGKADGLRHATRKEIIVGHRLPDPVMLFVDDADIYFERAKAAQGEIS